MKWLISGSENESRGKKGKRKEAKRGRSRITSRKIVTPAYGARPERASLSDEE